MSKPMRTFDWSKCFDWVHERKPVEVDAGLLDDWWATASTIYRNGDWVKEHNAYLMSSWATPGFKALMPNGDRIEVEAWREATEEDLEMQEKKHREAVEMIREMIREMTAKLQRERANRLQQPED